MLLLTCLVSTLVSLSITEKLYLTKVPSQNLCQLMETCSTANPPCKTFEDRVAVCGNTITSEYTTEKGGEHTNDEHNYAKSVDCLQLMAACI